MVSPEEIQSLCPLLHVDDLIGGLWIPGDGVGDPYQICRALIQEAQQKGIPYLTTQIFIILYYIIFISIELCKCILLCLGVTIIENCAVTRVINQSGRVKAVETTRGTIECQHFVNCAGFWARNVGKLSEPYVKVMVFLIIHEALEAFKTFALWHKNKSLAFLSRYRCIR